MTSIQTQSAVVLIYIYIYIMCESLHWLFTDQMCLTARWWNYKRPRSLLINLIFKKNLSKSLNNNSWCRFFSSYELVEHSRTHTSELSWTLRTQTAVVSGGRAAAAQGGGQARPLIGRSAVWFPPPPKVMSHVGVSLGKIPIPKLLLEVLWLWVYKYVCVCVVVVGWRVRAGCVNVICEQSECCLRWNTLWLHDIWLIWHKINS